MSRKRSSASGWAVVALLALGALFAALPTAAQLTLNWTRTTSDELRGFEALSLAVDPAGRSFVAGVTGDAYTVARYSTDGDLLWARTQAIGGHCATSLDPRIALDSQGNVVMLHRKYSEVAEDDCDCALTKFSAEGTQLWSTTSALPCHKLAVDGLDGVNVFASEFASFTIRKYSSNGVLMWSASHAANFISYSYQIVGSGDGSVHILSNGPGEDNDDIVLIKYSPTGTKQWLALYNGGVRGDDWPGDMVLDAAGNAFVVGYSDPDGENLHDHEHDIVTLKISAEGALLWTARYTSGITGYGGGDLWYDPWVAGIALDGEGNVIVAGRSPGGTATKYDFATVKYDAAGTELWARRYNAPANCDDQASDVAVGSGGNVFSVGVSEDTCPPNNTVSYLTSQFDGTGAAIGQERLAGPSVPVGSGYDPAEYTIYKHAMIELTAGGTGYTLVANDLRKYACVALTPPETSVAHTASTGSVGVVSHSGCAAQWTATSNSPWLMVTSGASGSGDGTVEYSVAENLTGAAREGIITIGEATFRLTQASDPCALTTPTGLTAVPDGMAAHVTWNATPGHRYELQRGRNVYDWQAISSDATPPFFNDWLFPHTYLYRVRAVSDCMSTPFSNVDLATIVTFTDDPLAVGVFVTAEHLIEIRDAVSEVRQAALVSPATYTDPLQPGGPIKAIHVTELRARLIEALTALGLPVPTFTDLTLSPRSTIIRRAHIQQLRDAVK